MREEQAFRGALHRGPSLLDYKIPTVLEGDFAMAVVGWPFSVDGFVDNLDGLLDSGDDREVLVGDLDELDGLLRAVGVVGGDRGDRIADWTDLVDRQCVLILAYREQPEGHRHVLTGEDGVDAGQRFGGGSVDPGDPGVGPGGSKDLSVEHSRV